MDRKTRTYELLVTLMIMGLVAFFLIVALTDPVKVAGKGMGPMEFPVAVFLIMLLLGSVVLLENYRARKADAPGVSPREEEEPSASRDWRLPATIFLIVVYALMWKVVGFSLSTLVYIAVQARTLNRKTSWLRCLAVGIGAVALVYVVFGMLFSIELPEPLLEQLTR